MHKRLLALLMVAAASGGAVGLFASAGAGKEIAAVPGPASPSRAAKAAFHCPVPERFRPAFESAARDTSLPMAMIVAVAQVESRLQPGAHSSAGARGLLQVMPATADELRLDASEPATNVLAGARYLRRMLDRFHSTDLALAAYNAGPTAVDRSGGAPSSGTLTYVANVTAHWRALVGCS